MRKIMVLSLLAGAAVSAFAAAPASADCVELTYHRVIQVTPTIFVEAPSSADTNPRDCLTTVEGVIPGGGR